MPLFNCKKHRIQWYIIYIVSLPGQCHGIACTAVIQQSLHASEAGLAQSPFVMQGESILQASLLLLESLIV